MSRVRAPPGLSKIFFTCDLDAHSVHSKCSPYSRSFNLTPPRVLLLHRATDGARTLRAPGGLGVQRAADAQQGTEQPARRDPLAAARATCVADDFSLHPLPPAASRDSRAVGHRRQIELRHVVIG